MLVLTRKLNETIQIGDNITITIVRVKGRAVGVGIEAPRDIRVSRGEIAGTAPASGQPQPEGADAAPASKLPSPAVITEALRLVLDSEDHAPHGDPPATLHQVIHRRLRRNEEPASSADNRLPRAAGRISLRDFLPSR